MLVVALAVAVTPELWIVRHAEYRAVALVPLFVVSHALGLALVVVVELVLVVVVGVGVGLALALALGLVLEE